MTVQTIPDIDEMTAEQQVELMEALWKSMSARNVNSEPPAWHLEYLQNREKEIAEGNDSFESLNEFEKGLRAKLR